MSRVPYRQDELTGLPTGSSGAPRSNTCKVYPHVCTLYCWCILPTTQMQGEGVISSLLNSHADDASLAVLCAGTARHSPPPSVRKWGPKQAPLSQGVAHPTSSFCAEMDELNQRLFLVAVCLLVRPRSHRQQTPTSSSIQYFLTDMLAETKVNTKSDTGLICAFRKYVHKLVPMR